MSVEITPKGTRGASFPKVPGWMTRGVLGILIGVFRLTGGRMKMGGVPLLVLTTVGAKSSQTRRVPLTWFRDQPDRPDRWLIVASLAGAANHPNWLYNLARNPDKVWIEVGRRKHQVTPETLRGAEREAAWRRIVAAYGGYGGYAQKTDRLIPVVRLMSADKSKEGSR